jgi:hypothetical protein
MRHLNTRTNSTIIDPLIYPPSCYSGEPISENIVFNHKLQIFAQEVAYIGGLEASGQITAKTAYKQIKSLWKQVRRVKKELKLSKSMGNLVTHSHVRKVT